jgi:hypothetical protein
VSVRAVKAKIESLVRKTPFMKLLIAEEGPASCKGQR